VTARRLAEVVVATPDATLAKDTFARNFGLLPAGDGLRIGTATIEFVTPKDGTPLAAALATGGEGMAELRLEVADLTTAAATLRAAGVAFEQHSKCLHVDPSAAHGVRLTLVAPRS
jgi:hypothetical protein